MAKDSIISKIQKLTAKAESAKELGNVEESALFSAKVNELLTKHNLAMSDIEVEDKDEVIGNKEDDLGLSLKQGKWTIHLLSVIADYNYCDVVLHTSRKYNSRGRIIKDANNVSATIIGRPENVEVTKYLYEILKGQFERFAKSAWKAYFKDIKQKVSKLTGIPVNQIKKPHQLATGVATRQQYFKSFYLGAVNGVKKRLEEQYQKAEQEYGAKITDLMVVNNADINAYMSEHFPNTQTMKSRTTRINGSAYNKGVEAGKSSSMAKGVASGASVPTKMLN